MDDDALAAAKRALRDWDVDVKRLEAVSLSENIVFKVTATDDSDYVLRLHRPGYHTLDELDSEQLWTAALNAAGIDVPIPKPTRTNAGYTEVTVHGVRRYVGMLRWVDGETMQSLINENVDSAATADHFSKLGGVLATIHNQATRWTVPNSFTRHTLDADGLMGEQPFWGRFWESPFASPDQQRWLSHIRGRIHKVLNELGQENESYGLIHADLHPGNIVVNGERLHVIDFDDCGFGWHQNDLANALFHFGDDTNLAAIRDALYAGYRKHRPLAKDMLSTLPLFLVIRALASIGWHADRSEHAHREQEPALIAYAQTHADDALNGLG